MNKFNKLSNPEKLKSYLDGLGDDLDTVETGLSELTVVVDSKTQVNDTASDSIEDTYSASKIEELVANIPSGGVEEAPIDTKQYGRKDAGWTEIVAGGSPEGTAVLSTGETGGTKFLREDGDGTCSWQTPAGGTPTVATGAEVNTGTDNTKMVTPKAMEDSDYIKLSAVHTQNTDTGTTGNTFTIDSDSATGKIIVDVALGAADLSLTLTNETLTSSSKTATLQNKTGTIALTSDIPVKATYTEINTGTDDAKFATALSLADSNYISPLQMTDMTEIDNEGIDTTQQYIILFDGNDTSFKKITIGNFKKYLDTLYTPL